VDAALRERVARIARWNGGSILVVAGLGALLSLAGGDLVAGGCGLAIATAGALEHRGGRRLADAGWDPAALRPTLVRCELAVLALIVAYSAWRLGTADLAAEIAALPKEERMALEAMVGEDRALLEGLFALGLKLTYGTLILVTLAYQGGMAWWYDRKLGSPA
jgi:hypothetical protein